MKEQKKCGRGALLAPWENHVPRSSRDVPSAEPYDCASRGKKVKRRRCDERECHKAIQLLVEDVRCEEENRLGS